MRPLQRQAERELGARHFSIPSAEWNAMTEAAQWAANQAFLDEEIAGGNPFLLATPLDKVRPGSPLEREINYLKSRGYKPGCNGTRLIP